MRDNINLIKLCAYRGVSYLDVLDACIEYDRLHPHPYSLSGALDMAEFMLGEGRSLAEIKEVMEA